MEWRRVIPSSAKSLVIGPVHQLDPGLQRLLERDFLSRAMQVVPGRLTEAEMEEVDWLVVAGSALTGAEQEKLAHWLGRHAWSGLIIPERPPVRATGGRPARRAGRPMVPGQEPDKAVDEPSPDHLQAGPFLLDVGNHTVSCGSEEIHLRPMEYLLMAHFLEYPNRLHHREELVEVLWGGHSKVDLRTVDAHVARLRKALLACGQGQVIETVFRFGYRFRPERAQPPQPPPSLPAA